MKSRKLLQLLAAEEFSSAIRESWRRRSRIFRRLIDNSLQNYRRIEGNAKLCSKNTKASKI
jgi:metal-responsive CopG/Arc/MetJ family transcriptional regulator